MNEKDILELIKNDEWMMNILRAARSLNLPDWWIGAGFVRSKIWDYLHQYEKRTPLPDVDVIFFDEHNILSDEEEQVFQLQLAKIVPEVLWSVTNQARMHTEKGDLPYHSATEGLATWCELPTCIGVTLLADDRLQLTAPWGIEDLVNLRVTANPISKNNPQAFIDRVQKKNWIKIWPNLKVIWPQ